MYFAGAIFQGVFLVLTLAAWFKPAGIGGSAIGRYCLYFALLNWASLIALTRFLRGQKQVIWQPRVG